MKHFQLAIASIVDASTGNGLVHGTHVDYRGEELRSRALRSKAVHGFFSAIAGTIRDIYENYREKARQRRAVADLMSMNDHFLEDIGLTRGDLAAVTLGQTSLEELNMERRARLAVAPLDAADIREVDSAARDADVVNEDNYARAKCA